MAEIRLERIRKVYKTIAREVCAVKEIDIIIKDGEFMSFVGPSGCGKTTTLRIIAGLESPSSGKVFIGDYDVTNEAPQKRELSMVFQDIALYPHMRVFDNIAYPLKIKGYPKHTVKEKVLEVAKLVEITELLNSYPNELSGGQKQRVAIGRSIAFQPKALLLDEPLSSLDAKLKHQIRKEFELIHKRLGLTIVYVTHDQEEAMTASDKITVMRRGEVQQIGVPEIIYKEPKNMFVATFFGYPEINLIESTTVLNGKNLNFKLSHSKTMGIATNDFRIPENVVNKILSTDNIILGFRPESIRIGSESDYDFKGEISIVEPMGSHEVVYINAGFGEVRMVKNMDQKTIEGDDIYCKLKKENMLIFDNKTENLIHCCRLVSQC
jgi:multiple sugar transport system ATP-binding protein